MRYGSIRGLALVACGALVAVTAVFADDAKAPNAPTMTAEKKPVNMEAVAANQAMVGHVAPAFTLKDASGKDVSLESYKDKYVVLEWTSFACPFVKRHYGSGNMQMLQADLAKKGVAWLTVCSSAPGKEGFFEGDALSKAIADAKWQGTAYLVDPDGSVGKQYGAKTTPHMFVIDPKGTVIYAGAIDDKRSANPGDNEGAFNYVRAALEAAMSGKAVEVAATQSYGCSVKYAS